MQNLFDQLDSEPVPVIVRRRLRTHLRGLAALFRDPSIDRRLLANDAAGLLATRYCRALDDSDPVKAALYECARLEVPARSSESADPWSELAGLLDKIPRA